MTGKTRLNRAVIAVGLSLMSLTTAFNAAAQPEIDTTPPTHSVPVEPPSEKPRPVTFDQQQLDVRLFAAFTSINLHNTVSGDMPDYDLRTDTVVHRKMDEIRSLLNEGADPNSFVGDGIALFSGKEMTAFQAAVTLSISMNAPDFLQFFIDKGGDVHKQAPDKWSPMDYAASSVMAEQGDSPQAFREVLAVIGVMTRAGAEISEARMMSDKIGKPIQTYADLATNIIAARIMAQQGLMTAAQLEEWQAARRQDILDETVRKTPNLTAAWIRANGGALNDFPDTRTIVMPPRLGKLTPPPHYQGGREVDLVVIEGGHDWHSQSTYQIARDVASGINPAVDPSQIHSWSEMLYYPAGKSTDALRMLMNSAGSPMNDRVVLSHSMAVFFPKERVLKIRQSRDAEGTMLYNLINAYADQAERSKPIIFSASGNWNPEEMGHVQSYALSHSPRSVHIGAVGKYGSNDFMMAPYSSHGADICAPLPMENGTQMEGTSFSTPLSAALFRQMNEWYGDILNFEEIMAAGLMSADRNVNEHVPPSIARTILDNVVSEPAPFDSNGGGLPNHDRCGAGVLNPEKWQAALNDMVAIKQAQPRAAQEVRYDITIGDPVVIPGKDANEKTRYIYRMVIPEDMTLGKLTFRLPQHQNNHSEIVVSTPAGFEKHLGYTHTDIYSAFAFAYEDVKAGQVMEIRTTEPLGPSAGMILRGQTPGNPIAALRDHLRSQGVLPAPLQHMSGETVTGPSVPVTPTALQDFIPLATPPIEVPGLFMPILRPYQP